MRQFSNADLDEFLESGFLVSWTDTTWMLAWGSTRIPTSEDHFSLYLSDFFATKDAFITFERHQEVSRSELLGLVRGKLDSYNTYESPRKWQEPSIEEFESYFTRIQSEIAKGSLQKAVPIVFAESKGNLSTIEKLLALKKLELTCHKLFPQRPH